MIEEGLGKDPTSVRVRQRIEQLRHERRLTLKALSDRLSDLERPLGVSTLSKMISGDRRVDVDDLVALALALDVSPNAIILPVDARPDTEVRLTPARALDAEQAWLWATTDNPVAGVDFFVSYIDADEAWAAWIGAQLEAAGQRVRLQAGDSPAGEDAAVWIGRRMQAATRTVVVCSATYLDSHWRTPEWSGVLAGTAVIPLRVADVTLPPMLADLGWWDLHGLDEPTARYRLLEAVGLAAVARAAGSAGFPSTPSAVPGTPSGAVPPAAGQPAVWNVPPCLATFIGRQDLLDRVRADVMSGAAVAMYGLGGVGKTQLAVDYCYRYRDDYDLVWWVPAEEPRLLVESLRELAEQVGVALAGHVKASARAAVEQLRTGGSGRFSRWLVVLDNAGVGSDDPLVSALLGAAESGGGHVLVTSRDPGWARLAVAVEVDVLPREEAVRLLRARAVHLPEEQADGVAEALGDLPVALEQAGAWLAESGIPASAFQELVRWRVREVLARGAAAGRVPVAATWTVALDAVADPAVTMLAHLWAHLGPEPIPLDLLGAGRAGLVPEPLAAAARDPLVLGDTVTQVTRLGLARLTADSVVMHRLVQAVLRDHTPEAERGRLHTSAVRLLAAAVAATGDPYSPDHWPRYDQLYPHARAADLIGGGDHDQSSRDAVMQLVNYLHARGDDLNRDRLAREARDRWAKTLGEDHPDTILTEGYLAYMLRAKGDYTAARKLGLAVRSRCRRLLGDDHPYTIKAGTCLGATLRAQRDFPTARALFEEVSSRGRRVLGEDHPDTMSAMANLAVTLRKQGDHGDAGRLCKDVLSRRRRVLGDDHPHTISTMASLAATLRLAGDHTAARALREDVLDRRRRVLGEDHPDTMSAMANLVVALRAQEETRAARALFGRHVVRTACSGGGTSSAATTRVQSGVGRRSTTRV